MYVKVWQTRLSQVTSSPSRGIHTFKMVSEKCSPEYSSYGRKAKRHPVALRYDECLPPVLIRVSSPDHSESGTLCATGNYVSRPLFDGKLHRAWDIFYPHRLTPLDSSRSASLRACCQGSRGSQHIWADWGGLSPPCLFAKCDGNQLVESIARRDR